MLLFFFFFIFNGSFIYLFFFFWRSGNAEKMGIVPTFVGSQSPDGWYHLLRSKLLTKRETYDHQSYARSHKSITISRHCSTWFGYPAYVHERNFFHISHLLLFSFRGKSYTLNLTHCLTPKRCLPVTSRRYWNFKISH